MDAHWVHGRPGCRCRHGYSSARPRPADGPKPVYWREDRLLEHVAVAVESSGSGWSATGAGLVTWLRDEGVAVVCGPRKIGIRSDSRSVMRSQLRPSASIECVEDDV
ncbi:hypothetical protein [Saccharothrix carnea]|uniref:hypothetical protein n=1 Tax=Saccharothrix TaxID=2071 RepID=UPI0011612F70